MTPPNDVGHGSALDCLHYKHRWIADGFSSEFITSESIIPSCMKQRVWFKSKTYVTIIKHDHQKTK